MRSFVSRGIWVGRGNSIRRRRRARYKEEWLLRSPSPWPSPPGRGRAIGRRWLVRSTQLQSPLLLTSREKEPNHLARSPRRKPVDDSPSPGGEGWGEGERRTNFFRDSART